MGKDTHGLKTAIGGIIAAVVVVTILTENFFENSTLARVLFGLVAGVIAAVVIMKLVDKV